MRTLLHAAYRFCTNIGRNVLRRQSEGQCHDSNRGKAPARPLPAEFAANPLSSKVALLSGTIGCSWLNP